MAEPIDPRLAKKLDAFAVPALPLGFAARAAAAALALRGGEANDRLPPLPRQRRSIPRRWWRMGAAGMGALAAGMLSISAAAMGYFGEPVRKAVEQAPVIGPVVERVIERVTPERVRPKPKLAPKPPALPSAVPTVESQPAELELPPRLRARMEARKAWLEAHPEAARRIEARKAWLQENPEVARRIAERRVVRKEIRRQAIREEMRRRRIQAGIAPSPAPGTAPAIGDPAPRAWRLERRERLRQSREHRRQMIKQGAFKGEASQVPEAPPQP